MSTFYLAKDIKNTLSQQYDFIKGHFNAENVTRI